MDIARSDLCWKRATAYSGERTALAYSCKFLRDLPRDMLTGKALHLIELNRHIVFRCHFAVNALSRMVNTNLFFETEFN